MQIIKNKIGMSEIIVNLALIMITISAVLMTYNFIMPILSNANVQTSPEYSCLELQTLQNAELQIQNACLDAATREIKINIKRSPLNNIEIQDLTFQFSSTDQQQIETFACGSSCDFGACLILDKGAAKTYTFQLNENENPSNAKVFLNACELDMTLIRTCE